MNAPNLDRLCIHQVTLLEQCDFRESVECLARNGVFNTAVWRQKLDAYGLDEAKRALSDSGVNAPIFCSGGFLTSSDPSAFQTSLDDNRRWLDQAAKLGAKVMVTLTGGLDPEKPDLAAARAQALEGLERLIPEARAAGVRLGLEPLHPMVCGLRSVLSTLADANDWLDQLGADDVMGITLDSYALWWDPALEREIERAGSRIISFHISDWLPTTEDVRLDRGMIGDGLIDNRLIRSWVERAGFDGLIEVEIFSKKDWWRRDPDLVVQTIKERFQTT